MGQTSSNNAGEDAEVPSKSHYELLDISPSASEEEIKKAYRRKALELHPDRNFGKEEAATALFAEIQTAYSVLSDPQERAWYDAHQAEFISGGVQGDGEVHYERSVKVTTAEDIRAMCAGRGTAFNDFSDSPNGFYTSVRELFERLAMEESIASAKNGYGSVDYPTFGSSKDEMQDVVKIFYGSWGGFATSKTFAWKDKYRAGPEYDRRTRRAIDKENQKARDEAVREFNDAVRTLVLFIRRRDPRYEATATTDAERQKILREAAAAQAARSRKENAAKLAEYAVPDWARSRGDQEGDDYDTEDAAEDEAEEEEEESESEPEVWECVVCSKTFKSEGQYDAHERSKKHKQAAAKLEREMRHQDNEFGLNSKLNGVAKQARVDEQDDDDLDNLREELENDLHVYEERPGIDKASRSQSESEPETHAQTSQQHTTNKSTASKPSLMNPQDVSEEEVDDSYASRSEIESRILGSQPSLSSPPLNTAMGTPLSYFSDADATNPTTTGANTPSKTPAKQGKAKAKRAKRAAKEATATSANGDQVSGDTAGLLECVACKEGFASKNKLFEHIKRTGHARPMAETGVGVKKKGKR